MCRRCCAPLSSGLPWRCGGGARPQNTAPSTVTPLPRNVGAVSAAPTAAGDDRAAHHFLREFARPILLLPGLPAALICLLRRGRSRALSDQIEPFDQDDFASWRGALRMAMRGFPDSGNRQRGATTPRRKRTRPPVGQIGSPGSLRRSPDAQASRFTPRLPGKPIRLHQIDSIWSDSALGQQGPMIAGRRSRRHHGVLAVR